MLEVFPRATRETAGFAALVSLVAGVPLALRGELLAHKALGLGWLDWRGILADLGVALCLLVVVWAARRRSRTLAALLVGGWLLVNVVNYEHIRVLNSQCSVNYAAFMFDPLFVRGSVLRSYRLALLLALLGALALSVPLWPEYSWWPPRVRVAVAGGSVAVLLLLSVLPGVPAQLEWRQQNVLVANVSEQVARWVLRCELSPRDTAAVEPLFSPDLSGTPRLAHPGQKPNILLVMVEGLSGAYVRDIAAHHGVVSQVQMPRLSALSRHAMTFTTALAQQRQTNRGEYSLLCGDYPKLLSAEPRMTEMARGRVTRRCLPQILREAGYRTAYLQAAPMPFMLKDKFMPRAGFEQQDGAESFATAYARDAWGVDDQSFFEQSLRQVFALESRQTPWFLVLLTVGTHDPYLVAPSCRGPQSEFQQAVRCADQALGEFVGALSREGVLDHTLVLITSDESEGLQQGDDLTVQLTQSWIPLVVLVPGGEGHGTTIHDVVLQSDYALSLLDYLGLADRAQHFVGRSIFRKYSTPRPAYFANTYLNRLWSLEPNGGSPTARLSTCTESFGQCASYAVSRDRPFDPRREPTEWLPELLGPWQAVVDYSVRLPQGRADSARTVVQLVRQDKLSVSNSATDEVLFGGQYLTVVRGTQADVDLEVEVSGPEGAIVAPSLGLQSYETTFYAASVPLLAAGDRFRIRGRWRFDQDVKPLEAVMRARAWGPASADLRVRKAILALATVGSKTRSPLPKPSLELSRGRFDPLRYSIAQSGVFQYATCMIQPANASVFGVDCEGGNLVFGPYAWAPAGTRLKARFRVGVTRGDVSLRAELSASEGSRILASGSPVRLSAGQSGVVESAFTTDRQLTALEARLVAEVISGKADVVVREAELSLLP